MTGGYHIVDGSGMIFSTGSTVTGLYNKLLTAIATGKAVIIEHAKYSSVEYTPFGVALTPGENVVYIDCAMGSYSVTSSDVFAPVNLGESKKGGSKK